MSEHPISETSKHVADAVAGVITVGAVAELITPIAALFTIIWTGLRVYILISNRIKKGVWE